MIATNTDGSLRSLLGPQPPLAFGFMSTEPSNTLELILQLETPPSLQVRTCSYGTLHENDPMSPLS